MYNGKMVLGAFALVVAILVLAFGATTAFAQDTAADTAVAGLDLHSVEASQTVALANAGYASSVDDLVAQTTEMSNPFSPRPGRLLMVAASTDGQHYIAATLLTDGRVLVNGDEHREPVKCESLNVACLSQVTADAGLPEVPVAWTAY